MVVGFSTECKNSKFRAKKNSIFAAMKNLEHISRPIADELNQFEEFLAQTLKSETEPMDSVIQYMLETKGKRLRPVLVLLSAKLFGKVNERTFRAASCVEIIHSATLIHDDVVDDADLRRGKASVKAYFGNKAAVLAGDYLLAKAVMLLTHSGDNAILQEMLQAAEAMSEGELMQNAARMPHYDSLTTNYLDIITRKTARLMQSACVSGALSVNARPEQIERISHFGLHFGILFQLRDDFLDAENVAIAKALLPDYLEKTLLSLEQFPDSEFLETLKDLTVFCAEREE